MRGKDGIGAWTRPVAEQASITNIWPNVLWVCSWPLAKPEACDAAGRRQRWGLRGP